jgi:hypothetical protein
MRIGGPLLLLALWRWRQPEARLLAALACAADAESVRSGAVVPTRAAHRERVILLILMLGAGQITSAYAATLDFQTWTQLTGQSMVWLVYLPCLVIVLRRRT